MKTLLTTTPTWLTLALATWIASRYFDRKTTGRLAWSPLAPSLYQPSRWEDLRRRLRNPNARHPPSWCRRRRVVVVVVVVMMMMIIIMLQRHGPSRSPASSGFQPWDLPKPNRYVFSPERHPMVHGTARIPSCFLRFLPWANSNNLLIWLP